MRNHNEKLTEKREDSPKRFDFEDIFNSSIDSMSLSIKESFHTFRKDEKKRVVLKLVECMEQDSSASAILSELLSEISGLLAQHSKEKPKVEYAEYGDEEELTVSQVLQACPTIKSPNTVKNRVRANKLIGFTDSKVMKLPAWQFNNGAVLPGLEKAISFIGTNGVPAVRALETPMERFEGKPAYEYLRKGDLETVISIIKLISEK